MIWILATRGIDTKLTESPFTETPIAGAHSVVYKPGIQVVPYTGEDAAAGPAGTFAKGLHRVSGVVFTYDGSAAETLLGLAGEVDLVIRYRAAGEKRKRTISGVLFAGDAAVTVPAVNTGTTPLIGVPFRVQIPEGETVTAHVTDTTDP